MQRYLYFLLVLACAAPVAYAQHYTTRGFSLGVGLQYAGVEVDESDFGPSDSGGGLGLSAEYGFNDTISLFTTLDGSGIDEDTGLGHFDLGVKLHFAAQPQLRPFVMAALSGVAVTSQADDSDDTTLSGGAFTIGGGVRYFFSRTVLLDIQGAYSPGEFNQIEVGGHTQDDLNIDMHSYRLRFGVLFNL